MSQLYEALTAANDEVVERLESLSSTKELDAQFENDDKWTRMEDPLLRRLKTCARWLPGNVSHSQIRTYLILIFVAIGIVAMGTEYGMRPGSGIGADGAGVYGVAFEGTIHPASEIRITSSLGGTVSGIFVKVGDVVKPGQPLLRLDDREVELSLSQASADLRTAENNLDNFRLDLANANARVAIAQRHEQQVPTRQWRDSPERAEAAYDLVLTNYNRVKELFDAGVVSQQELDARATDLKMTQDDLNNAKRLADASANLERDQTEQANLQARVTRQDLQEQRRQAQVRYQHAKQDKEAMAVRATKAGTIAEVSAKLGDRIPAGTVLLRLAELDRMIVEVPVSSKAVSRLKIGQDVQVELPSSPPQQTEGHIRLINPLPSANMTHSVEVEFHNAGLLLIAGQPAEVRFQTP